FSEPLPRHQARSPRPSRLGPTRRLGHCLRRRAMSSEARELPGTRFAATVARGVKVVPSVESSMDRYSYFEQLPPQLRECWEVEGSFLRGELSEERYLAKAGTSRVNLFDAHFDIGIFRLGAGDRAGAREHFQRAAPSVATSRSIRKTGWSR